MPIKYQMLGGGGGLIELTIKTSAPNTTVTITKENFEKTLVSDDTCLVTCKLTNGTYQIKAQAEDGIVTKKEVVISSQEETDLRDSAQAKDLPIGAKFKFANGKTYAVQLKNANTVQFISEFILEDGVRNQANFKNDSINTNVLPKYYEELSALERGKIVSYEYPYTYGPFSGSSKTYTFKSFFSIPSIEDMNAVEQSKRIKKYKGGSVGEYWERDGVLASDNRHFKYYVDSQGSPNPWTTSTTNGIVPVFNIQNETVLRRDSDGYWVITE